MSYQVIHTIKYTIDGRPIPKERPRHHFGNIGLIASAVFNIFKKNPRITLGEFTKKFAGIINRMTKNAGTNVYTPQRTQNYEQYVAILSKSEINKRTKELKLRNGKIKDNMLVIHINLYFANRKVGDVDNYTKSILDGMHSIFEDDKQVKKIVAEKFIKEDEHGNPINKGDERAEIIIEVLDMPVYYNSKK